MAKKKDPPVDTGTSAPQQTYANDPTPAPLSDSTPWIPDERAPANAVDQTYPSDPAPAPAVVERICEKCGRVL